MEQKSFEQILAEKMAVPVSVKGKEGTSVMPMEAMVLAVMNDAMHGSVQSIQFIRSLTERTTATDEAAQQEADRLLGETRTELTDALRQERLEPTGKEPELELLARDLLTLRRVARAFASPDHRDIVVTPQKAGGDRQELSITNKVYIDLRKQWLADYTDFKQQLMRAKMMRR